MTLSAQLSNRLLKYLRKHPNVTQKAVADHLELSQSYLSEILSGKKNISGPAAKKLILLSEKPTAKADPTIKQFEFRGKRLSSHIEHFSGNDGAWVPGLIGSGTDPNDAVGRTIGATPPHNADDCLAATLSCLRSVKDIHLQA